jgi:hypothetical protein
MSAASTPPASAGDQDALLPRRRRGRGTAEGGGGGLPRTRCLGREASSTMLRSPRIKSGVARMVPLPRIRGGGVCNPLRRARIGAATSRDSRRLPELWRGDGAEPSHARHGGGGARLHHRAKRLRQDHAVQCHHRSLPPERGGSALCRRAHHGPQAPRDRSARHPAQVPGAGDLSDADGAGEPRGAARLDGRTPRAAGARRPARGDARARRPARALQPDGGGGADGRRAGARQEAVAGDRHAAGRRGAPAAARRAHRRHDRAGGRCDRGADRAPAARARHERAGAVREGYLGRAAAC